MKSKIRQVVWLRQIMRQWRKLAGARKAARSSQGGRGSGGVPADVPAGHLAVYVGNQQRRFVMRATYLNHPVFRALLRRAQEEFGYDYQGGISIPCDEVLFEQILRLFDGNGGGATRNLSLEELQTTFFSNECHCLYEARGLFEKETRPLLSVS